MLLVAVWLAEGALVGLLALGARLRPPTWGPRGHLILLAIACGAALLGGLLGTLLLGRLQSPPTALWVAVVAVVAAPWISTHRASRANRAQG